VLIQGETGTGKELVARALHYLGTRRDKPFIPVNCGALPDTLFESELFGHEKGAFTDARQAQQGLIALAEEGTLFLDEIDSLPLKAQIALLRFLQDRQYRPVGGRVFRQAHVHVIAACNVDLQAQVGKGGFRRDLLYRVNVAQIDLPALRARASDIPLLAEHFVARFNRYYDERPKTLVPSSVAWLENRPWPGNVRELENAIHRAWLVSEGQVLEIGPARRPRPPVEEYAALGRFSDEKSRAIDDFERAYLQRLMVLTKGNVTHAARVCGKERRALGRLLKKHGVDVAAYRRG
jgi:DNA-binding NtrC family response regulator